jgi:toxin FitB
LSYFVDTCVVSEARRRSTQAIAWLNAVDPAALFLSVITIGEIAKGIAARERTDPVAAAALVRWLDGLRTNYADRILSIDDDVAIAWGHLMARGTLPVPHGLLAATAQVHNLILVTRNLAGFVDTGVGVVNPWAE